MWSELIDGMLFKSEDENDRGYTLQVRNSELAKKSTTLEQLLRNGLLR